MRYADHLDVINVVLGAAFFFGLRSDGLPGFQGLAIATSTASWVNVILLDRARSWRAAPDRRRSFRVLLRIFLASAIMVAACCRRQMRAIIAFTTSSCGSKEASIALIILGGGTFGTSLSPSWCAR
ncbi:MAG: hypothetical protein IPL62_05485 [Caulobacteraceae bacterium]|nr:hypothetical protein [Caulobacteraceae bacterium]